MEEEQHLPMIPEEDEDEKNLLKKSTNTIQDLDHD